MDVNSIIDIAFGVAVLFVGYTINRLFHNIDELWRKHDEVTQRLTKIAIEIPKEYVTKKRPEQSSRNHSRTLRQTRHKSRQPER